MIFVMPGGSQVGRLTISHLINRGIDPSKIGAGARSPSKIADLEVVVRAADYDNPDLMAEAFKGVETLLLIPSKTPPAQRCVEHANALDAAQKAGVKRVVFLSILSASPNSVSAIAPFILFAENALRNAGMEWVILRMGLYLEPVADWVPDLKQMGHLPYPVRDGATAYVTRDDVARSLAAVGAGAGETGGTYTIAAPHPVTMPDLARAISDGSGQEIPFKTCSGEEFLKICLDGNEPPFIANVLLSLYRAIEAGEFDVSSDDVERLTGKQATSVADYFKTALSR